MTQKKALGRFLNWINHKYLLNSYILRDIKCIILFVNFAKLNETVLDDTQNLEHCQMIKHEHLILDKYSILVLTQNI